jgi:hypothetical protein
MTACVVCGNEYHAVFEVTPAGRAPLTFDSFECAIQALAPTCGHCDTRVIGHGVEVDGVVFCCAHCARSVGQPGPVDRVETPEPVNASADVDPKDLEDLDALDRSLVETFPASDPPAAAQPEGGTDSG